MKEPRVITAQKIKRALQMWKKAVDEMKILTNMHVSLGSRKLQVSEQDIIRVAKIFNLDIQKTHVDHDSWCGSVWLEGVEIYSYKFNFNSFNPTSYKYQETKKLFKQAFFEADGDREKAFEIAKKRSSENRYSDYFEQYKNLSEIMMFWKRHDSRFNDNDLRLKYIEYKRKWEDLEWNEREGNFRSPYTFNQWLKYVHHSKVLA